MFTINIWGKSLECEISYLDNIIKDYGLLAGFWPPSVNKIASADSQVKSAWHAVSAPAGGGGGGGKGGGTPIGFLYRDVQHVRVSFSWFSVLNRVYNFTFLCLKRGLPSKSPFLPFRSHTFCWFRVLRWNVWKRTLMYRIHCFEYSNAMSSLEQGKKLQHFLLDRVAKFTPFVSWTGSGFRWTPLPKFLLSTDPGSVRWHKKSSNSYLFLTNGQVWHVIFWEPWAKLKDLILPGSPMHPWAVRTFEMKYAIVLVTPCPFFQGNDLGPIWIFS